MIIGVYDDQSKVNEMARLITKFSNNIIVEKIDQMNQKFFTYSQNSDDRTVYYYDLIYINVDLIEQVKTVEMICENMNDTWKGKVIFVLDTVKYLSILLYYEQYHIITDLCDQQALMHEIRSVISSKTNSLTIRFGVGKDSKKEIPYEEISYIVSNRRYIEVIGNQPGQILGRMYCKLDEIEKELPDMFLRCHKSYIVNSKKITKRTPHYIWLKNFEPPFSISRSRRKKVNQREG